MVHSDKFSQYEVFFKIIFKKQSKTLLYSKNICNIEFSYISLNFLAWE